MEVNYAFSATSKGRKKLVISAMIAQKFPPLFADGAGWGGAGPMGVMGLMGFMG